MLDSRTTILILVGLSCLAPFAGAGESYPSRPIRMIVPLTAGSAADVLARGLASKMTESWGQQVVVDNRPGAGGTLGSGLVARSAPDGYTILVHSAAFVTSPPFYPKLPYDAARDFAAVTRIAIAPLVLVVAPSFNVRSVSDLLAVVRQKPGQIAYGSSGVGTSTHFASEQFRLAAGLSVVHVPYKGPPEVLVDTMAGRIQFFLSPPMPAMPFIKERRLLALAVTTKQRSVALPDVPTVAEAGVAGYDYQDWWGMFAPAGTPVPVIAKLNDATARIARLPDVLRQLQAQGAEPSPSTAEEFSRFVSNKLDDSVKTVKVAGIRIE